MQKFFFCFAEWLTNCFVFAYIIVSRINVMCVITKKGKKLNIAFELPWTVILESRRPHFTSTLFQ